MGEGTDDETVQFSQWTTNSGAATRVSSRLYQLDCFAITKIKITQLHCQMSNTAFK